MKVVDKGSISKKLNYFTYNKTYKGCVSLVFVNSTMYRMNGTKLEICNIYT